MVNKEIALQLQGITESPYGGFWTRLGAHLLDAIFISPVIAAYLYLNSLGLKVELYTSLPYLAIVYVYYIYLPKRYGGTPGKMIAGVRILRTDGLAIGLKEAFLRYLPTMLIAFYGLLTKLYIISQTSEAMYNQLSWIEKNQYISAQFPFATRSSLWLTGIWYLSLCTMFFNKKKRATHDFIAGTEVVKVKYLHAIQAMEAKEGGIF